MVYAKLVENQNLINTYTSIYKKNRFELEAILGQFNGGIISLGDVAQQKLFYLINSMNYWRSLLCKSSLRLSWQS